jgi:archaellum component FlaC
VLIYYRIKRYGEWFTNLYGVLFLEEVSTSDYNTNLNEDDERAGYIQRYPKFKKGNSWGLKLDLKIDAQPDSQLELRDKDYTDPNEAIGMQMFTEALMQLNDCTKLFYEVKKENTDIEERLYKLENIVSGIDSVSELRNEAGILRARVEQLRPSIDLLEGRMEDAESRITKLETNLGRLIVDIKNRYEKLESNINDIRSKYTRIRKN